MVNGRSFKNFEKVFCKCASFFLPWLLGVQMCGTTPPHWSVGFLNLGFATAYVSSIEKGGGGKESKILGDLEKKLGGKDFLSCVKYPSASRSIFWYIFSIREFKAGTHTYSMGKYYFYDMVKYFFVRLVVQMCGLLLTCCWFSCFSYLI